MPSRRRWSATGNAPHAPGRNPHGLDQRATHHRQALASLLAEVAPAAVADRLRLSAARSGAHRALDILGRADIENTARQLSELADALIEAADAHVFTQLCGRFGPPQTSDGRPAEYAVIAMGKLGGRELNFSSDVDLIFIYRGEGKTQPSGGLGRSLPNEQFFQRRASEAIALLSQPTEEGLIYRVDVRLRPDGRVGQLARSLEAVALYYESFAAGWERQALLRARPVAGDAALGRAFMETIRPHAFRKYVDMVEVNDTLFAVESLRRAARRQFSDPETLARHLKQRPGGIRDIEFLVQLVQMLYGGQYPEIRVEGTPAALRRIHQSGLLSAADFDNLLGAYLLLRRVEHRLQMAEDRQVYSLPADHDELARLAWRLGFSSGNELTQQLDARCQAVAGMLAEIFGRYFVQEDVGLFLSGDRNDPVGRARFTELGFSNPGRALEICGDLARDDEQPYLAAKLHRLAARLLPKLLDYLREEPDPDSGLLHFCRMAMAAPSRAGFLEALLGSPGSLRLLATIASASPFLSELLERFPGALDLLQHPQWFSQEPTLAELSRRFESGGGEPRQAAETHAGLLALFGARYLLGLDSAATTQERLSDLAQIIVQRVFRTVLLREHPHLSPENCGVSLIGLGKLGGRELNFGSDLDLLFVYGPQSPMLAGAPAETGEPVQRFCGEVLREFSSSGWSGSRYEVDARLRPFGSQSPLAVSLPAAQRYYCEPATEANPAGQAGTWERLALLRARPVAGDPQVAAAFMSIARGFALGGGLSPSQLDEVEAMRARIEREKGRAQLKAGRGGILDVEFLAQVAQLVFGRQYSDVLSTQTHATLRALLHHRLLCEPEYGELVTSFYFLRDVENSLRIVGNVSVDALPVDSEALAALARRVVRIRHARMGSDEAEPEDFFLRLGQHQERVRRNYQSILARWRSQVGRSPVSAQNPA
ncbi:hypothetical protein HS125_03280 [bacterium]|nr:hypothetical protein [bacterium]